jgi:hypothetical protein
MKHEGEKCYDMRHWHQVPRDYIPGYVKPFFDDKIVICFLPQNAGVEIWWHASFEIVILEEVNKLKRCGVKLEFIPQL